MTAPGGVAVGRCRPVGPLPRVRDGPARARTAGRARDHPCHRRYWAPAAAPCARPDRARPRSRASPRGRRLRGGPADALRPRGIVQTRNDDVETFLYSRPLKNAQQALAEGAPLGEHMIRTAHQQLLSFSRSRTRSGTSAAGRSAMCRSRPSSLALPWSNLCAE